jgi:hypothetical protein
MEQKQNISKAAKLWEFWNQTFQMAQKVSRIKNM